MATFVDQTTIHAQGGNGGHGCASVMREKFKPLGGPDGGNGGRGIKFGPQLKGVAGLRYANFDIFGFTCHPHWGRIGIGNFRVR